MSPPPFSRKKKAWCLVICFGLCLSVLAFSPAGIWAGASAENLGDKNGEVGPAEVKSPDPNPAPLKVKEPLPLQPAKSPSEGETPTFRPTKEGVKPGRGGAPVRPEPPPYTPRSRFMA